MDTYENQPQQEQPAPQQNVYPQQTPYAPPSQPYYPYGGYQQPYYPYQSVHTAAPQSVEKKGSKALTVVLCVALAVVLFVSAIGFVATNAYWQNRLNEQSAAFDQKLTELRKDMEDLTYVGSGDSVSGSPNVTPDDSLTPAQVYAKHADSVVAIECQLRNGTGSGSGFIFTTDGYIVTNYHVVEDARKISVMDSLGKIHTATYVGGDAANDIAVIKVQADNLQAATIGRSDHLIVGDQVVAIGNPLGTLASTLTVGYVSAKDRMVDTDGSYMNMIQTDAAINPGNSGGPLFNMKGEVIGITSAKYSGTTSSGATIEGIGFAIPMDDVIDMLEDIMETGHPSNAYLGVTVKDVDAEMAQQYGIAGGALVASVDKGGAAEKGGMQAGDVIVKLDDQSVSSVNDLTRGLRRLNPGDTIAATVYRPQVGEQTLSVTLGEKSSQSTGGTTDPLPDFGDADDWFDRFFGQG